MPNGESKLDFLFDLGMVLIHADLDQAAREISEQSHQSPDEILQAINQSDIIDRFDEGTLDSEGFNQRITTLTGWRGTTSELESIWQRMLKPDQEMLDLIDRLMEEKYRIYILSNANPFHSDYVRATYPFLKRTHGHVFSCECGLIKPDEAIYHHTAKELDLTPASTLFIDDRLVNITAARRVGYQTLHHKDASTTRKIISGLLNKRL